MQIDGGCPGWSGLKLTETLISHPFRGVLGLIPFPKAVKYSINSYFDVLLDNAFKVEQKVKYKSGLGITGSYLQWNISKCAVTKGTVVLKSVMLTDLALLSTSGLSEFSRVHRAQLLISFKNLNMGAILFSRHPRSRTEIGSGKDRKFDWKTRLLVTI